MPRAGGTSEKPALFVDGPDDFGAWLEAHAATETELWMGLTKKGVEPRGLTWEQAVPEALCFGWIDSRAEGIDERTRRQRWTPRKRTSTWSRVNLDLVERLTAEGRMRPAGIAAWEARRSDRQAIYAYEQAETLELPEAYARQLAENPAATAFWAAATPSYRKIGISWVCSGKRQATNDARMDQLVALSAAGQLIPSQRYGAPPGWLTRAAAAAAAAAAARVPAHAEPEPRPHEH